MPNFATAYALLVSEQVPVRVAAEWLSQPMFAAYVARRRAAL